MSSRFIKVLVSGISTVLLVLLFSCSNTDISVSGVYPRVIFAYEQNQTEPEAFLSFYGEVIGDIWRLDSLILTHKDSGFTWKTGQLDFLTGKNDDSQYAGYAAFRPTDRTFPAGSYTATWYEKSGKHFTSEFSLSTQNYELPQKEDTVRNVLVEDKDRRILYAGQMTNDFLSADSILRKYPEAVLYRKYVLKSNTRILYVYPPVYVKESQDQ